MKVILNQIISGNEEVEIRYHKFTPQINKIKNFVENIGATLEGIKDNETGTFLINANDILYFESVDGCIFAYKEDNVYQIRESLNELLLRFEELGFIRCSRTMLVNIYMMNHLKSMSAGKIQATLKNNEQIIISRKYAKELKNRLLQEGGKI